MILSAHQPNFFPWSPILEKAEASDVFVLLQNAQFVRGNFHNRFSLSGRWLTMSVNQSLEPLSSKNYSRPAQDWAAIQRKLEPFRASLDEFTPLIEENLVNTKVAIIRRSFELLRMDGSKIRMESCSTLKSTERLISLCVEHGAKEYLSGPSGRKYLQEEKFNEAGIKLSYSEPLSKPMSLIERLVSP